MPRVLPVRPGGAARRAVVLSGTAVAWAVAAVMLGAGVAPSADAQPVGADVRVPLVVLGLALLAAPVLLLYLPSRRGVRRQVTAVLEASVLTAATPAPELPPFASWGGPAPMFKRLMVSSFGYLAIPLLLLVGWAVACAFFLGEGVAAVAFAVLALVPLAFVFVTLDVPRRVSAGVRAGLASGQVVPVRVENRIDQKMVVNDAFRSWFDAVLPDGQRLVLRTPMHFRWAGPSRGVLDAPDLVLVIGQAGHQGVLLASGRPEDPVWLLGPVPLVRAPRSVLRSFAERGTAPA